MPARSRADYKFPEKAAPSGVTLPAGVGGSAQRHYEANVMRHARLSSYSVALILSCLQVLGCSGGPQRARAASHVAQDPCDSRKSGDVCLGQLPLVPPVIAGEGRIWALFPQGNGYVLREFSERGAEDIVSGACPGKMAPAVLGMIRGKPALLCADYATAGYSLGLASTTRAAARGERLDFDFKKTGALSVGAGEKLREISHFVPVADRGADDLAVLYRTFSGTEPPSSDGVASASIGAPAQPGAITGTQLGAGRWWLQTSGASTSTPAEALCSSAGASTCGKSPLMLYEAEGQVHVVMSNGKANASYVHLARVPGKGMKSVPVTDVPATGTPLRAPCVSGLSTVQGGAVTSTTFTAYTPTHNLVGSLLNWQGEHMGVIEQPKATLPQGPDVWATTPTRCPPDVRTLGTFPNGTVGATTATTRWLRATRSGDTWLVSYAVPAFSVKQGEVTYSYPESFWVLRRRSRP